MTQKTAKMLILVSCLLLVSCTQGPQKKIGSRDQAQDIPAWFNEGKFGMFIHWGPYSVLGGEWKGNRIEQGDIAEWIMQRFQIPVEEYRKIAAAFNPTGFDAREWVSLAKKTGMKYIIITSKHHDGFAMYDSKASDYNIVDYTPFKRDPLRELPAAGMSGHHREQRRQLPVERRPYWTGDHPGSLDQDTECGRKLDAEKLGKHLWNFAISVSLRAALGILHAKGQPTIPACFRLAREWTTESKWAE